MRKSISRRSVLVAGVAATSTVFATRFALADESVTPPNSADKADSLIDFNTWNTADAWGKGKANGVTVTKDDRPGIVLSEAVDTVDYKDPHTGKTSQWEIATWTSDSRKVEFGANQFIASWNASTPTGSWLQIEAQATYHDGKTSPWYVMGRWASGEKDIVRTSVGDQTDDRTSVDTDTVIVADYEKTKLASYQLRLTLHRKPGTDVTPTVWRVSGMSSYTPSRFEVPASKPGEAAGIELKVPAYSQNVHDGQYPEYGGGGESWCSPTSSQMIIESWGRKPSDEDLSWIDPDYADPQVCYAARNAYDKLFDGCGNWPFNAAYASTYDGIDAVITRLTSLNEAETLIKAGFPIITSQSFTEDELDGAGYGTDGHLMTVIGFTEDGDVIANDPASKDNDAVRHVYKRHQFETIFLRSKRHDDDGNEASAPAGVCYLYKPLDKEWPAIPGLGGK